jgi:hypothetical protein
MEKRDAAYWQAILTPEIEAAAAENRAPDFSVAGPGSWAQVLDRLLVAGRIEIVGSAARQFHSAFPRSAFGRTLCTLLDRLPPAAEGPAFADIGTKDFQLAGRNRSETFVLMFCDASHQFGIPLFAAHRFFGRLPATFAYLRDFRRLLFLDGVPSLGSNLQATLAAIRTHAASIGARRIICLGNSGGTFAALKYGLELEAEAVVGFAGPTNLAPEFTEHLRPIPLALTKKAANLLPAAEIDLRKVYADAESPPRVALRYGANNWDDRIQAEHLRGFPKVSLLPIPGLQSHNVLVELIRRDQLQPLLDWLVSPAGEPPQIPEET